jgi:uncharacterized protein YxjI
LKKKNIISMKEHYDQEDRNGMKGAEAEGNLFQSPAKFVVKAINGSKLMCIESKTLSGKSSHYVTMPESFSEL